MSSITKTWRGGTGRRASRGAPTDEAESCPLELHAERASDFEAIMLVVGTTVGGGFLAMPYFAAPAGFVPAVLISCGAWAVLAASGLLVSETLMHTWARSNGQSGKFVERDDGLSREELGQRRRGVVLCDDELHPGESARKVRVVGEFF